jgi:hypothetical protein
MQPICQTTAACFQWFTDMSGAFAPTKLNRLVAISPASRVIVESVIAAPPEDDDDSAGFSQRLTRPVEERQRTHPRTCPHLPLAPPPGRRPRDNRRRSCAAHPHCQARTASRYGVALPSVGIAPLTPPLSIARVNPSATASSRSVTSQPLKQKRRPRKGAAFHPISTSYTFAGTM